jgi:hypothetical protein
MFCSSCVFLDDSISETESIHVKAQYHLFLQNDKAEKKQLVNDLNTQKPDCLVAKASNTLFCGLKSTFFFVAFGTCHTMKT